MPGQVYLRNLRLSRAYAEGVAAIVPLGTNPHVTGTPEADAWEAGYSLGCGTAAGEFDGAAECTGATAGPTPTEAAPLAAPQAASAPRKRAKP